MHPLAQQDIVWKPGAELVANSNLARFMREHDIPDFDALLVRAEEDPQWWWRAVADRIAFIRDYDTVLDVSQGAPFARWCTGGTTNIVLNALDRHRGTSVWTSPAIFGETETGQARIWTYEALSAHTSRLAAGMKSLGIGHGDVVAVYMPNVNEAIAGLLAIAKIGAIAMPLFSGFGVEAIATRLRASQAVAMLTVDGASRRGRWAPMKEFADAAADRLRIPRGGLHHLLLGDLPQTDPDLIDFARQLDELERAVETAVHTERNTP